MYASVALLCKLFGQQKNNVNIDILGGQNWAKLL